MKRRLIALVLGAVILLAAVPSAYAALSDGQKADIAKLEAEIAKLRKQQVQKYVDAGEITPEQGKLIQERVDTMQKYRAENGFVPGMGQGGCGGGRRGGAGFGGCGGGGCGNGTVPGVPSLNSTKGL